MLGVFCIRYVRVDDRGFIPYNIVQRGKGDREYADNPPHIHAITQVFDAPFLIETGEIMDGEFLPKAQAMVKEFVLKYQKELLDMWVTEKYIKLPPLK